MSVPKAVRVLLAISRAWAWTKKKAVYKLGAGGRNPQAPTPFTVRDGVLGCDCIGFVLWCLGLDRFNKAFTYYGGWMNTDSIIFDAKTGIGGGFWELTDRPQQGDLVVYPSIYKSGKIIRYGHVGIVVEVPEFPVMTTVKQRTKWLKQIKVIDCNSSKWRKLKGMAIGLGTAADHWDKPDAVFVRYRDVA